MKKSKKALVAALVIIGCASQITPVMAMNNNVIKEKKVDYAKVQNEYERTIVDVKGEKMSYIQLGNVESKKSIVIVHGSAFNASAMLPYGELYAKDGYNVVLVDMPGHYGNIAESKDTLKDLSDSVANLMKNLIKEKKLPQKSEVQGWSLGGTVALDIAARYKNIVNSVGIIDSASNYYGLELPLVTEETKLPTLESVLISLKSTAVSQDILDGILAKLPNILASAEAVNNDFAIDNVLNIDSSLKNINVPVYNFYGKDDALTTIDKQYDMMKSIKKGELFVAEGYNHLAVLENPQLVYDAFTSMKQK